MRATKRSSSRRSRKIRPLTVLLAGGLLGAAAYSGLYLSTTANAENCEVAPDLSPDIKAAVEVVTSIDPSLKETEVLEIQNSADDQICRKDIWGLFYPTFLTIGTHYDIITDRINALTSMQNVFDRIGLDPTLEDEFDKLMLYHEYGHAKYDRVENPASRVLIVLNNYTGNMIPITDDPGVMEKRADCYAGIMLQLGGTGENYADYETVIRSLGDDNLASVFEVEYDPTDPIFYHGTSAQRAEALGMGLLFAGQGYEEGLKQCADFAIA